MTSSKRICKFRFRLFITFHFLVFGLGLPLQAQVIDKNPNIFLSRSNGLIPETKPLFEQPGEIKMFLENDWYIGDVKSFEHEFIINKPLKYEMISNRLEIQINGQMMALSHSHVKSFEWFNVTDNRRAIFLNCKNLLFKGDQPTGFLEILLEGKITLSSHKTVNKYPVSPQEYPGKDYENESVFVKEKLYYSVDGGLIMSLPEKRKHIFRLFDDKKEMIKQFISWNNLVLKNKGDLIKTIEFYNLLSE